MLFSSVVQLLKRINSARNDNFCVVCEKIIKKGDGFWSNPNISVCDDCEPGYRKGELIPKKPVNLNKLENNLKTSQKCYYCKDENRAILCFDLQGNPVCEECIGELIK